MGKRLRHLGKYANSDNADQVKDLMASKKCGNGFKESSAEAYDFGKEENVCKVAQTTNEASRLMESGFDFVCDMNRVKLFRKWK